MRQASIRVATLSVALSCVAVSHAESQRVSAGQTTDLVFEASVTDLQNGLRTGRWTSVQLVDAYLARITAYDRGGAALNAMIRLSPHARREAAALDRERASGRVRGPFHGIPIVLKDNFDTRGMATSAGSLALAALQTPGDGFVVRRLRDAGAVIIGKTNMHELAAGITSVSSLGGQTRNPYDPMRCPGGSSGGTGVAVAASFAAVGWGSDTCGSIRIPSAYNSLFGLRPTQGLVSRRGIVPLSHTQDIAGPLARTATDLAIALDVTIGADPDDSVTRVLEGRSLPKFVDSLSATALRGARLGVLTNYMTGDIDNEIRDTIRAAVNQMKAAGAEVVDVRIADFDSLLAGSGVINFETEGDLADYLRAIPGAPQLTVKDILDRGLHHDALTARIVTMDTAGTRDSEPYRRALAKQRIVRARVIAILDSLSLDVLVYPTMRRRPVLVGEPQPGGTCGLSANTGLPALSAPAGFTSDGLPVGVEFVGRPFADARLVALAFAWEQRGARRRAPSTTPALHGGRVPRPLPISVSVPVGSGVVRARFVFDQVTNQLRYDVLATGVPEAQLHAVVFRRHPATGGAPVFHRATGPGVLRAAGSLSLSGADRHALIEGRISLGVLAGDADGLREARLKIPGNR
ncbi:MAG: amidase [Gemmatimonadaceae bacterium]